LSTSLSIGDVVGVWVPVLGVAFHHVGVVTCTSPDILVVSKSWKARAVVEQSLHKFAGGRPFVRHRELRGALPASVVVDRARARLGERWHAFANCEHFVREVQDLPSQSPQLREHAAIGGLVLAMFGAAVALKTSARRV